MNCNIYLLQLCYDKNDPILGLQATDNNHDARITALEESGGGGSQNGI